MIMAALILVSTLGSPMPPDAKPWAIINVVERREPKWFHAGTYLVIDTSGHIQARRTPPAAWQLKRGDVVVKLIVTVNRNATEMKGIRYAALYIDGGGQHAAR